MKRLLTGFGLVAGLVIFAEVSLGADKLVVLSPHRKSIQDEYVPAFKDYYKKAFGTDVEVEWIDQGGTSNDLRFLKSKLEKTPVSAGIDIFWGGGTNAFVEMNQDKLLQKYDLPKDLAAQLPKDAAGVPLYDDSKTWYASAMSSFGLFYNKKALKMEGLAEPSKWEDLADAKFLNQLSLADPRQSGTANTMNTIVVQGMGWDKGFEILTKIAGNTRKFTHSSSDPIKAVVSGDAAASTAIDFYAQPKVDELGKDNLGFLLPEGQTVLDPDPIALVKGAPNQKTAQRFVDYVLSISGQKLLILPKGSEGGPKIAALGRMAVTPEAYKQTEGKRTSAFNPFQQKAFLKLDAGKAAKLSRPFNDLLGAIQIDTHDDLKKAWAAVIKRGMKPDEVKQLTQPPVTEAELMKMADKWDDEVFRNKTINAWVQAAKAKYAKLTTGV